MSPIEEATTSGKKCVKLTLVKLTVKGSYQGEHEGNSLPLNDH